MHIAACRTLFFITVECHWFNYKKKKAKIYFDVVYNFYFMKTINIGIIYLIITAKNIIK